jgi:glycolate oxidase FAD binding subunit
MAEVFRPTSEEEVKAIVAEAAARGTALSPRGHGTKSGFGRPVDHTVLDTSGLKGVVLYEPEELVMTARAGTPLAEIVAMLDGCGQELAFEPPLRTLLWNGQQAGTIGGLVMTALSGPRRIKAGAVRDHVLGIRAVSGRGEIFKAGGRVVKNVTGYDVPKGLVGSFGTLAVLTEVTLKTLPKAETEATLVLPDLSVDRAVEALCAAMGSAADVSGAARLPAGAAERLELPATGTLLRLEGIRPSVDERFERLAALLASFGRVDRLDARDSASVWRSIRDREPVAAAAGYDTVWRISVRPTAGPVVASMVNAVLHDWSGGLVWAVADSDRADGDAETVRAAVAAAGGGHATLMRGPDALRARIPVFQPQPAPLAALSRRVKAAFDPAGVLNPGRMVEAD